MCSITMFVVLMCFMYSHYCAYLDLNTQLELERKDRHVERHGAKEEANKLKQQLLQKGIELEEKDKEMTENVLITTLEKDQENGPADWGAHAAVSLVQGFSISR